MTQERCELLDKSEDELETMMLDGFSQAMHAGNHLGHTQMEIVAQFASFIDFMNEDDDDDGEDEPEPETPIVPDRILVLVD